MSILSVTNLVKKFYVAEKKRGFFSSIGSLFCRSYICHKALDGISFSVTAGEIVGYIGPNGAGKSTTIKLLSGILVPDSGEVLVFGKTPWKTRIETVSQIGVVFGQRTQLWWDLAISESFDLLKAIYNIPDALYKRRRNELIEALQLEKLLQTPARQLSLGQRMRSEIAASLLHNPKILFLDEPTIGLDAVSKLAVRDFILHLNKEYKTTIILTTHDMDDIVSLCKRVIVLHEGKIFFDGSLASLRKKMAPERYLIVDLEKAHDTIYDLDARLVKQEGHRVWLSYNPEKVLTQKLIARITTKHAIRDLFIENPPIEELIAKLYKEANL